MLKEYCKMTPSEIFVRKASGLARTISAWDALVMCILIPGIYWPWVYQMWAVGLFGPGVYMPLSALLAILMMIPNGLMYVFLSVTMPRSGGDYVWVGRILHPALGFTVNWYITLILLSWAGPFASWITEWGIAPIFYTYGMMTGNSAFIDISNFIISPNPKFLIGTIILIIMGVLSYLGSKWEFKAEWISIVIGYIGLAIWAIVMIQGGSMFAERMAMLTDGKFTFEGVINMAKSEGWDVSAALPVGLGVTGFATTYTTLNFLGYTNSAYIAGEIKGVTKSQIISILGSLFIFGFTAFGIYLLYDKILGAVFINSLAYLDINSHPYYWDIFPIEPLGTILSMFATTNPYLPPLFCITFAFGAFGAAMGLFLSSVRNIFAWSFDRVLPATLSAVDERRHSPYMAILLTWIISFIMNVLYIYTTALKWFLYSILAWWIAMVIVAIGGIILPWVRKDIFETAPGFAKSKIAGLPVVSIVSAISIPISIYLAAASINPAIYGSIDWLYIGTTIITFIIAPVIYGISYLYHKTRGIPIELAHKRIPPE
jgi:amino acid transporter